MQATHLNLLDLGDEYRQVVEITRDLIRRLEPQRSEFLRQIFEEQRFPEAMWEQMAEAGLLGLLIPEEYGGTGLGLLAMALVMEELASAGYGNALVVVTSMDTTAILRGGSEEQKQRWLPRIADGSLKLAFAITEPESGTNSFRMKTEARKEGGVYRLRGEKGWITGADVTDMILVVARTIPYAVVKEQGLPRTYGLGLFLVDRRAPGLHLYPMNTAGIEGYRQFRLVFDDVEVPADHLIGAEHMGAQVLFSALNPERILAAATGVGLAEHVLRRAAEYARQRKVFGDRPIGSYQAVQHPLARIRVMQEAARLLTYRAAQAFDRQIAPERVGTWANMAKYLASETAIEAVDRAIQTFGGQGFVRENQLIHLWTSARLLRTAPINNEMVLNFIAEHELELPRSY